MEARRSYNISNMLFTDLNVIGIVFMSATCVDILADSSRNARYWQSEGG